eukprot:scaffold132494_cov36-Tisochrysis_lutea.AAC.3
MVVYSPSPRVLRYTIVSGARAPASDPMRISVLYRTISKQSLVSPIPIRARAPATRRNSQ